MPEPWNIIDSKRDRSFRIFNLRTDRAVSPRTGQAHDFYIRVELQPIERIPELIRNNTITHALVICAFYRYFMERCL